MVSEVASTTPLRSMTSARSATGATPGLWATECRVLNQSFIGEPITTPQRLECRVRYRDPRVAIELTKLMADVNHPRARTRISR